jgi:hypothetical protein
MIENLSYWEHCDQLGKSLDDEMSTLCKKKKKKEKKSVGTEANNCSPIYLGGRNRRIMVQDYLRLYLKE